MPAFPKSAYACGHIKSLRQRKASCPWRKGNLGDPRQILPKIARESLSWLD
jgi:hypothetical protein